MRGFWAAEAARLTHDGGVGRAIAEWIVGGAPSIEARSNQQYIEDYDVIR